VADVPGVVAPVAPHWQARRPAHIDRLVLVEDVLLQLFPVVVALREHLAHEGIEVALRECADTPDTGAHDRHEDAKPRSRRCLVRICVTSWQIHRTSDVSQSFVVLSNRNASSMSARAFSSDAITVRRSVTDSMPRKLPWLSTTSRW